MPVSNMLSSIIHKRQREYGGANFGLSSFMNILGMTHFVLTTMAVHSFPQQHRFREGYQHRMLFVYKNDVASTRHVFASANGRRLPRLSSSQFMASEQQEMESEEVFFSPNPLSNDYVTPVDGDDATISNMNEYSFFDEAIIYIKAGSGGQGAGTFKKGVKGQNTIPDGGNGGKGGDVILVADDSLNTLAGLTNAWRPNSFGGGGAARQSSRFRYMSFTAENGADGGRGYSNGKFGKDVIIRVPPGTVVQEEYDIKVKDEATGKTQVAETYVNDIGSVDLENNSRLIVAYGGEGGEGTAAVGNKGRGVKRVRAGPVGGKKKRLKLTLKVVADVALVAVPNAGKSTTLASVTRAKPKISNYPFGT